MFDLCRPLTTGCWANKRTSCRQICLWCHFLFWFHLHSASTPGFNKIHNFDRQQQQQSEKSLQYFQPFSAAQISTVLSRLCIGVCIPNCLPQFWSDLDPIKPSLETVPQLESESTFAILGKLRWSLHVFWWAKKFIKLYLDRWPKRWISQNSRWHSGLWFLAEEKSIITFPKSWICHTFAGKQKKRKSNLVDKLDPLHLWWKEKTAKKN